MWRHEMRLPQVDDSSGSIEYLVRQKALVSIAAEVIAWHPLLHPLLPVGRFGIPSRHYACRLSCQGTLDVASSRD